MTAPGERPPALLAGRKRCNEPEDKDSPRWRGLLPLRPRVSALSDLPGLLGRGAHLQRASEAPIPPRVRRGRSADDDAVHSVDEAGWLRGTDV